MRGWGTIPAHQTFFKYIFQSRKSNEEKISLKLIIARPWLFKIYRIRYQLELVLVTTIRQCRIKIRIDKFDYLNIISNNVGIKGLLLLIDISLLLAKSSAYYRHVICITSWLSAWASLSLSIMGFWHNGLLLQVDCLTAVQGEHTP